MSDDTYQNTCHYLMSLVWTEQPLPWKHGYNGLHHVDRSGTLRRDVVEGRQLLHEVRDVGDMNTNAVTTAAKVFN